MDREGYYLLGKLKQACSQRYDRYWELLATAAGNTTSVKKTLSGLATQELRYGTPIADNPVMAEERVLALSVSHPVALRQLFDEWEDLKNKGELSRDDAWLVRAWGQARSYFTQDECDLESQPWYWYEEFTPFYHRGRLLAQRPLVEKYLTCQDIQAAISEGEGVLRGLRTQQVRIEESTFYHYSNQIESLNPYILALLIELSRASNFDQNIWIERFFKIISQESNPLELTRPIYCLLNPSWFVP